MNARRLPVLLLMLVVLPVPARADDHKIALSFGFSPGSLALRPAFELLLREKGTPRKRALFAVGEASIYVQGRDSSHAQDGGMIGLRYFPCGQKTLDLFVHGMGGLQSPSSSSGVTGGDNDDGWSGAGAVGFGADIKKNQSKKYGIVPVLRLQFDLVESGVTDGFDPYGRFTFGASFRFEYY